MIYESGMILTGENQITPKKNTVSQYQNIRIVLLLIKLRRMRWVIHVAGMGDK
jgi:hypothetical protein